MTVRAELDLASYDRLLPGAGLLAERLVRQPDRTSGFRVPAAKAARPCSSTTRLRRTTISSPSSRVSKGASVSGVNLVAQQLREVATGPVESTYRRPFRGDGPKPPDKILAVAGAMLAIDRIGLPPALVSALKHLASLHNPEYYEKERLRLSTWNTPRLIRLLRGVDRPASAAAGPARGCCFSCRRGRAAI